MRNVTLILDDGSRFHGKLLVWRRKAGSGRGGFQHSYDGVSRELD